MKKHLFSLFALFFIGICIATATDTSTQTQTITQTTNDNEEELTYEIGKPFGGPFWSVKFYNPYPYPIIITYEYYNTDHWTESIATAKAYKESDWYTAGTYDDIRNVTYKRKRY